MENNREPVHATQGGKNHKLFLCGEELSKMDLSTGNYVFYTRLGSITCSICLGKALDLTKKKDPPLPEIKKMEVKVKKKKVKVKKEKKKVVRMEVKKIKPLAQPKKVKPLISVRAPQEVIVVETVPALKTEEVTTPVVEAKEVPPAPQQEQRKFYFGVDVSLGKSPHHAA